MCCLLGVSCDVSNTAQPSSPRGEETPSATNAVTGPWQSSQVCEVGPLPGVSGFLYLWGKNRRLSRLPPSANATLNLFLISQLRPSPEARCVPRPAQHPRLAAGLLLLDGDVPCSLSHRCHRETFGHALPVGERCLAARVRDLQAKTTCHRDFPPPGRAGDCDVHPWTHQKSRVFVKSRATDGSP